MARYKSIDNIPILNIYKNSITGIHFPGSSATLSAAKKTKQKHIPDRYRIQYNTKLFKYQWEKQKKII